MKAWMAMACAITLLGGCAVDDWVSQMNADRFRKQCAGYGFRPGSDAFSNCMMQQSAQDEEAGQRMQDRMQLDNAIGRLKK